MNSGNISFVLKLLPLLAFCALTFGLLGWWLRKRLGSDAAAQPRVASTTSDTNSRDRIKKLEEKLQKAEGQSKSTKHDYEALQKSSVPRITLEDAQNEIATLKELDLSNKKRIIALEADAKKAQASISAFNASGNEADRLQKDKTFALENELSKTREQLARNEASTDRVSELQAEIDRLRENLANANRVAGDIRRKEIATSEVHEKLNQSSDLELPSQPVRAAVASEAPRESDRILAARAEVIRLNANRAAAEKAAQLAAENEAEVEAEAKVEADSEPIAITEEPMILLPDGKE